MPEYRVIWQIDLAAETSREAAERAAEILRRLDVDDECSATVFDVYERHRRLARVTAPVWAYVVVTGWVIYMMLYRLPG